MPTIPNRKSKKWASEGIKAYVMLMFEYLRLSPSFALAHRMHLERTPKLKQQKLVVELYGLAEGTAEEKKTALENFQNVMATYAEFGNVYVGDFNSWWLQRGIDLYAYETAPPKVHPLAQIKKGQTISQAALVSINDYLKVTREAEDRPDSLLLSVPLGLTKKQQLALISKCLDNYKMEMPIKSAKTKRPLQAIRLRSEPLKSGLGLLWSRAIYPKEPLWKLGSLSRVSKTYSRLLDPVKTKPLDSNWDARNNLTSMTHRMLTRAQLVAENAAHGLFPSHEKRLLPVFDLEEIYQRVILYRPKLARKK
jgi:hypothetical protein